MTLLIGLLTVVLVLDCVLLILLVLVQLPKKEAGMGQAFGGAATDALFGAGSGNALTKLTKWAAGIFFVLAIILTVLTNYVSTRGRGGSRLQELMNKAPVATPPPPTTAPANTPPPASTNAPIQLPVPAQPSATPNAATPTPAPAPAPTAPAPNPQ